MKKKVFLSGGIILLSIIVVTLIRFSTVTEIVLSLERDDAQDTHQDIRFAVNESLEHIYCKLETNSIKYTVEQQNELTIISCFGSDSIVYDMVIYKDKLSRIEASNGIFVRGTMIPTDRW